MAQSKDKVRGITVDMEEYEQYKEEERRRWVWVGDNLFPTMHEICNLEKLQGIETDRANRTGSIALAISSVSFLIGIIVLGFLLRGC